MRTRVHGLIFLTVMSLCAVSPTFGSTEKINWQTYEEGMALGKNTATKVFIYFWAPWCGYCKKMDAVTFNDPGVISILNEHFIPVRVDLDKEKNVARGYNVRGVPLSWFISETGERIGSKPGYSPPQSFLPALKFIYTDSFRQMTFDDFLKGQKRR